MHSQSFSVKIKRDQKRGNPSTSTATSATFHSNQTTTYF